MTENMINISSEIARLKKVLLHRPGKEIERLTPDLMARLLFDDIPFLEIAQQEHDEFANVLKQNGAEVLYLEDLLAETIVNPEIREKFIDQFLAEAGIRSETKIYHIKNYFAGLDKKELVKITMEGLKKSDLDQLGEKSLGDMAYRNYPFILEPMPNLYFTRDPFASIGNGITLNKMFAPTRNRETIFSEYIFRYHPDFVEADIPHFYNRYEKAFIEGGDILVLNNEVLAIGISQRTRAEAVEKVAKNILFGDQTFTTILAFNIPKKRAFMHLDTVFTMVDYDKFTIHAAIEDPLRVFSITAGSSDNLKIREEKDTLKNILKKYLSIDKVHLIRCAGGDLIDAGREQWNDGSNTLAIAPGEVVVYSRNYVTNQLLQEKGVKTHKISSSELSRGRGGPRCMSMPLYRE